jgi:hypothetical protein
MPLPIRVLRRKRRQTQLSASAADVVTWFVDNLSSGGGQTVFELLFLATGMTQTADTVGTDFRVFYDGGTGYGERTIASTTAEPTVDGFRVTLTCNDEITGGTYQVTLSAYQTCLAGPQGQRVFAGQSFPAGIQASECSNIT